MKNVTLRNLPELSYAGNEAINTLCTNLTFSGENIKVIMLTSCHASEGKSFLALNIVRTMAKLGKRVCLIDCDLRKSVLARRYLQFDTTQNRGATHFLAGMADVDEVLYETDIPNMYIVPCGRNVSNSLPLVTSSRLNDLIHTIAVEMDYVIVDAPPVGMLIDAAERAGAAYAVDIYPSYGSDVEATLSAGYDIRHGLIGPGVYASHGYERSHKDGVAATLKLLAAFIQETQNV